VKQKNLNMPTLKDFKKKAFANPEVKKEYENLRLFLTSSIYVDENEFKRIKNMDKEPTEKLKELLKKIF